MRRHTSPPAVSSTCLPTVLMLHQLHSLSHCCRHVTEADLEFFKDRVERDMALPGVGKWQHMTDLKLCTLTYSAWRRRLAVSNSPSFDVHEQFIPCTCIVWYKSFEAVDKPHLACYTSALLSCKMCCLRLLLYATKHNAATCQTVVTYRTMPQVMKTLPEVTTTGQNAVHHGSEWR